jgi:hypothetical protein
MTLSVRACSSAGLSQAKPLGLNRAAGGLTVAGLSSNVGILQRMRMGSFAVKSILVSTVLAAASALSPVVAAAQTPPACAGHYEVIRTDTVKPGQMAAFRKAVMDQQAWYKNHGLKDRILIGTVLEPGSGFSATSALTIHTDMAAAASPPHDHDPAWDAFVAEYKASSDVVATYVVCVAEAK